MLCLKDIPGIFHNGVYLLLPSTGAVSTNRLGVCNHEKKPTNFHQLDKTQKLKVLLLYLAAQPQEVCEFHGFLKTHI